MTEQRRNWPAHVPALLAGAGTVFVAATAFVLAYGGSKGAALDAGISPAAAGWYPLCIEGALVVASVSTVILRGKDRAFAWIVLLLFVAVSTAANVLHSIDHGAGHWWSPYAAAVPPLSLPICTWLAERVALSTLHQPTHSGDPVTPRAGSPVPPVDATQDGSHVHTPPAGPPAVAADSGLVDVPAGVHQAAPDESTGRLPDTGPTASTTAGPDAAVDVHPDTESTVHLDADRTRRAPPRRTRTGRAPKGRTGRPAGHSPDRPQLDWREVDWYAVAVARDVQRARAYEIMKAEPDAVRTAREQLHAMNGSAP